jgi:hypothetical protein
MSPETPHDFRQHASNCERMAAKTKDPRVRKDFLYVASRWRELAAEHPNVASYINPYRSENALPASRVIRE